MSAVNLARLLDHAALRLPLGPALVAADGEAITWRELQAWAAVIQNQLCAEGLAPGGTVMIACQNSPAMVAAMWGIWRAGGVLVPVNVRAAAPELAYVAELSQCRAGICDPSVLGNLESALNGATSRPTLISTARADSAHITLAGKPAVQVFAACPAAEVGYDDPAWYFFTSGTTGKPKAAVLTHGQMSFVINNHLADLIPGVSGSDLSIAVAPLSHGAGIHMLVNAAKGAGTVLVHPGSLDTAEVLDSMARHGVTNLFATPTIVRMLTEEQELRRRDLTRLRQIVYAGAPMYRVDQKRALRAFGQVLVQYFGLAEVTGAITYLPAEEHSQDDAACRVGTAGFVRTGMDIKIIGVEDGRVLASGETGEICTRGPAVFKGYLNNPAANEAALRGGWFCTGDLGYLDEQGYLYITGRKSDMYISGGMNVYPREVEEVLLMHPDVAETAVLGVPHRKWGEAGVCVIVARRDPFDTGLIRDHLRAHLAPYKIPKAFVLLSAIPKTAYGKVSKREIGSMLLERHADALSAAFGESYAPS